MQPIHRQRRAVPTLALLAFVAACGNPGVAPTPEGAVRIRFVDREAPAAFSREGEALRDGPDGSPGLWAAVRGLPRPERAEVVNLANRRKVIVALFNAGRTGADIRLSAEAADALRVTDTAPVRITALRREPRIGTTKGR